MARTHKVFRTLLSLTLACGLVPAGAVAAYADEARSVSAQQSANEQAGNSRAAGDQAANQQSAADQGEAVAANVAAAVEAAGQGLALEPVADGAAANVDVAKKAAKAVDSQVQDVLDEYFQDRSQTVMGQTELDQAMAETGVAEAQQERANGFAQLEEAANIKVTGVETAVTVTSAKEKGSTVQIQAYEQVTFTYTDYSNSKPVQDTALFGTAHDLTLATDSAAAPVIESDVYDELDLCGVATKQTANAGLSVMNVGDEPLPEGIESGIEKPATGQDEAEGPEKADPDLGNSDPTPPVKPVAPVQPEPAYQTSYNPVTAVAYSNKYWSEYNKAYVNFNPVGGDCANFTSQAIAAGGMTQKSGDVYSSDSWFYTDGKVGTGVSSSWIYCPTFVNHFKKYGKYVENPGDADVFTGSPVVYRTGSLWSHAVLCVGQNKAGTPIINSHNNDRYHMPYTYYTGAKICTVQLTKTNIAETVQTTTSGNGKTTFTWLPYSSTTAHLLKVETTDESVAIPTSVTLNGRTRRVSVVGTYALRNCTSIKSVRIPKYVVSVRPGAFRGCSNLAKVTGCAGLQRIYGNAFNGCKNLTSLPTLSKLTTLSTGSFRNCYKLTKAPIPAKATSLSKYVFTGCRSLKSVSIPSTVKSIGAYAFYDCRALTSLTIPYKVASIGEKAFYKCSTLKKITLKTKKLTSANVPGKYTFAKTPSTVKVYCGTKASAYKKWLYKRGLSSKAKIYS